MQTVANYSKSEKTDGRLAFSRYQEMGEAVAALHWLQAVGRLLLGQERTFLPAAVCDLWWVICGESSSLERPNFMFSSTFIEILSTYSTVQV